MEANTDPLITFTKESWIKESLEDNLALKNQEQDLDLIDDEYEQYLQNDFQDALVSEIFNDMVSYIGDQAIPICEFFEIDDVELLIDECF